MAVGCATGTVCGFVLRFRAARDTEADARACIFQQLIAPDGRCVSLSASLSASPFLSRALGSSLTRAHLPLRPHLRPRSQLEAPDPWLERDNPWELPRADVTYQIRFYGHSERLDGNKGIWSGGQEVLAIAYDVPIPGYETKTTNNLRLWESRPKRGFDLQSFNGTSAGETLKAEIDSSRIL